MANLIQDDDLIDFIGVQESQSIRPASDFIEEVIELVNGGIARGDQLPWSKTHENFRLREHEVTVWAGINGHGKSLVLSQIALWLMTTCRVVIASMEMPPPSTLYRMVRQSCQCNIPSEGYIQWFGRWTDDKLWIYDQTDSVEPDRILGLVNYSAKVLGARHIIVDSLLKCGIAPDDYSKQKELVDRLCWAAKRHSIHVHLVHHIRKGKSELDIPDKWDLKGAGEIADLVDNVVIIHRNKRKEKMVEAGGDVDDLEMDVRMLVEKQRHYSWEGMYALYYDDASQQITSGPNRTHEWMPGRAYSESQRRPA